MLLPDGSTASAVVLVDWCDALPEGSPARFDVGLGIDRIELADLARLDVVLRPRPESDPTPAAPEPVRVDRQLARAQELHDALQRVLETRDHFMAAVRSAPENVVALREEELFVAALHGDEPDAADRAVAVARAALGQ